MSEDEPNKPLLTINNIPIHFSDDWNTGIGGGLWSTGWAMACGCARVLSDVIAGEPPAIDLEGLTLERYR